MAEQEKAQSYKIALIKPVSNCIMQEFSLFTVKNFLPPGLFNSFILTLLLVPGDLTVTNKSSLVVLTGGAKADCLFWITFAVSLKQYDPA